MVFLERTTCFWVAGQMRCIRYSNYIFQLCISGISHFPKAKFIHIVGKRNCLKAAVVPGTTFVHLECIESKRKSRARIHMRLLLSFKYTVMETSTPAGLLCTGFKIKHFSLLKHENNNNRSVSND